VPEIVDDGRTGVLVPPGDERAFAQAVIGLLDDSPRRQAMGHAGLERARREFSVARMTDRTLDVYREALA
jgi:glycosyltransferase involved in cell wall biosynthesis